jgi:hypothetical protein
LIAGLAPPFDREIVEAGLREVVRDDFRFGRCAVRVVAQKFRGAVGAAPDAGS